MKNSLLILGLAIVLSSCASKTSFNSFYSENKADCEFSISTPAFFANLFIPKEDIKEYEQLFKKVKHYKVMIFSDASTSLDKRFDKFIKRKKYTSIFKINSDLIWRNQLMAFGDEYQIWANAPKNPALN